MGQPAMDWQGILFSEEKYLYGFRHKTDTTHDNGICLHLGGFWLSPKESPM
jgi:hypothetical protein